MISEYVHAFNRTCMCTHRTPLSLHASDDTCSYTWRAAYTHKYLRLTHLCTLVCWSWCSWLKLVLRFFPDSELDWSSVSSVNHDAGTPVMWHSFSSEDFDNPSIVLAIGWVNWYVLACFTESANSSMSSTYIIVIVVKFSVHTACMYN